MARLDLAGEYRGDDGSLSWQADYAFDRYGNRTSVSGIGTPSFTTSYNTATNRIATAGISYDAAGQTLSDSIFRGQQYQYNPEGRLKWSANLDGSSQSTSVYNGLGQRLQTTHAGVTKSYFYDINGSVVAEHEATPTYPFCMMRRLNVNAGGRLLAIDELQPSGTTYTKVTSYRMGDRQGSTRVLMDAAGAVTSRHDYLPFGEELGAGTGAPGSPTGMRTAAQGYSVADNVRQRYAETRLDDATGLDHTLWRKLETKSGRWTTPDPYGKSLRVANPQSFNRYAYVNNDPVNYVDPSGLDVCYPDPATGQTVCIQDINAGTVTINIGSTGISNGLPGRGGGSLFDGLPLIEEPPSEGIPDGGGIPQNPVPLPGTDAIKDRLTGDCNAYIASLLAKASELYGGGGNVAVAKDGLDLLNKISSQGGFVLKDFLTIDGYPVGGTVTGSIAGNNTFAAGSATVLISTRFMYGSNAVTTAMWQANYVSTAIHEMLAGTAVTMTLNWRPPQANFLEPGLVYQLLLGTTKT